MILLQNTNTNKKPTSWLIPARGMSSSSRNKWYLRSACVHHDQHRFGDTIWVCIFWWTLSSQCFVLGLLHKPIKFYKTSLSLQKRRRTLRWAGEGNTENGESKHRAVKYAHLRFSDLRCRLDSGGSCQIENLQEKRWEFWRWRIVVAVVVPELHRYVRWRRRGTKRDP